MKVGIVGCGLIGNRRARVAQEAGDDVLLVADINPERARETGNALGTAWTSDWQELIRYPQIEAVVVSTVNKSLLPVTLAALWNGKHVLCEKPLGRNAQEAKEMVETACAQNKALKVGFNHRHHPAIWKAHELCARGAIGPLMFIRAVYGHGGRPGYDREWRADPDLAGGGELLDQGVHIIDLCRWFLGDFTEVYGVTATYFWNLGYFPPVEDDQPAAICNPQSAIRNRLEDNAFAFLRTADGRIAQWHTSWTQWKNRFTFEVFGCDGYVRVEGLGGSYGTETLTVGYRRPESGPPNEERFEFPGPDLSWQAEWREFVSAIREGRQPLANGEDGLQAMRLIAAIYESAQTGQVVHL